MAFVFQRGRSVTTRGRKVQDQDGFLVPSEGDVILAERSDRSRSRSPRVAEPETTGHPPSTGDTDTEKTDRVSERRKTRGSVQPNNENVIRAAATNQGRSRPLTKAAKNTEKSEENDSPITVAMEDTEEKSEAQDTESLGSGDRRRTRQRLKSESPVYEKAESEKRTRKASLSRQSSLMDVEAPKTRRRSSMKETSSADDNMSTFNTLKQMSENSVSANSNDGKEETDSKVPVKRGRGRPRKYPLKSNDLEKSSDDITSAGDVKSGAKHQHSLALTAEAHDSVTSKVNSSIIDDESSKPSDDQEEQKDLEEGEEDKDNISNTVVAEPKTRRKKLKREQLATEQPTEQPKVREPEDVINPELNETGMKTPEEELKKRKKGKKKRSSPRKKKSPPSYPCESVQQNEYFSMFGLMKKSDLRTRAAKNKLHREVGGKLRRVIKPRMAPEMVYKKLTLTKGCVLEGGLTESTRYEDNVRRVEGVGKVKRLLMPKLGKCLEEPSLAHLGLASTSGGPYPLLKTGSFKEEDLPSNIQRRLEFAASPPKKQWLQVPKRQYLKPPVRKKKPKLESTDDNMVPLKKSKSEGNTDSASDAGDDANGKRLSSRRGGQRKEWWHLLRAAPDEFERDVKWEKEQEELRQRKVKYRERMEQLQSEIRPALSGLPEYGSDDDAAVTSSQEATKPDSRKSRSKKKYPSKYLKEKQAHLEHLAKSSDAKAYADLFDEMSNTKMHKSRKKDWALAKNMLDEARARMPPPAEPTIPDCLLDEHGYGVKKGTPARLKTKPKKVKRDSAPVKPVTGADGKKGYIEHAEAKPTTELGLAYRDEEEEVPRFKYWPDGSPEIHRSVECKIPHMCIVCWINDHMYCINMKRTARELPSCGACMHYMPCSHYRNLKGFQQNNTNKKSKIPQKLLNSLQYRSVDANQKEEKKPPTCEKDLLCEERMPDSDSDPGSPKVPAGTEILKLQLRARAEQITESLGVEHLPVDLIPRVPHDDNPDDDTVEDEIPVTQHGAEVIVRSLDRTNYLPNQVFLESEDTEKDVTIVQPDAIKRGKTFMRRQDVSVTKVRVRLLPSGSVEVPRPGHSPAANQRLIRVVVQHVDDRIVLHQTAEFKRMQKGKKVSDMLRSEIEFALEAPVAKPFDMSWLAGILAEEALMLAESLQQQAGPTESPTKSITGESSEDASNVIVRSTRKPLAFSRSKFLELKNEITKALERSKKSTFRHENAAALAKHLSRSKGKGKKMKPLLGVLDEEDRLWTVETISDSEDVGPVFLEETNTGSIAEINSQSELAKKADDDDVDTDASESSEEKAREARVCLVDDPHSDSFEHCVKIIDCCLDDLPTSLRGEAKQQDNGMYSLVFSSDDITQNQKFLLQYIKVRNFDRQESRKEVILHTIIDLDSEITSVPLVCVMCTWR